MITNQRFDNEVVFTGKPSSFSKLEDKIMLTILPPSVLKYKILL